MSPEELLVLARSGDLDALGAERDGVADAVESFAEAGDPAAALEFFARGWRIWLSHGELGRGSAVAATALGAPGAESVAVWRARALHGDGCSRSVQAIRRDRERETKRRSGWRARRMMHAVSATR